MRSSTFPFDDPAMERFKRNHLKKLANSLIPYKAPFDKTRSISVWNGRELPRGGFPQLNLKNTETLDSLYESQTQISEKIIHHAVSSGQEEQSLDFD